MLPARGENIVMNKRICVYCGQMIAGADYHVVGIGQDYANLLACVGCWRERGFVGDAPGAPGTSDPETKRHNAHLWPVDGLYGVCGALAILPSAMAVCGAVGRLWLGG